MIVVLALVAIGGGVFLLAGDDDDDQTPTPSGPSDSQSSGAESSDRGASPEEQAYIDAVAEVNQTTNQGVLSPEEAGCIGEATVNALGLEALQVTTPDEIRSNVELTLADLGVQGDQATIDRLADAINECVDVTRVFVDTLEQQGFPGVAVDCIEEHIDTNVAATYLSADYAGSQDVRDAANAAMEDLLSPCEDLLGG